MSGRARPAKAKPADKPRPRLLPVLRDLELDMLAGARLNGKSLDVALLSAVTGLSRDLTMDGANIISLTFQDEAYDILRSRLLNQQVTLDLGDAGTWRYHRDRDVGALNIAGRSTTLTMWALPEAVLRAQTRPLSRSAAQLDLEGFVSILAREDDVRREVPGLRVIVPDPDQKPPDDTTSETTVAASTTGTTSRRSAGSGATLKVKGNPASDAQKAMMRRVLAQAQKDNAGPLATLALFMAVTTESEWINGRGKGADAISFGILQLIVGLHGMALAQSPEACVHRFLVGPAFTGSGPGAIALARRGLPAYAIAQGVQGSGAGRASNGAANYGPWHDESKRNIAALGGDVPASSNDAGSGSSGSTGTRVRTIAKPSSWRRGTAGKTESSWSCLDRYAQQFGCRRFIALPASRYPRLVVARDQQLILAFPHLTLNGLDDPIIMSEPSVQLDGVKKAKTIDFDVLASGWSAPPGGVVHLKEAGPLDGPWIVARVVAKAGEPIATVSLQQPTTQIPPAPAASIAASSTPRSASVPAAGGSSESRGGLASPVQFSSVGGYNSGHDGADLMCAPNAPIYAICDAKVIDVRAGGWWNKNVPANVDKTKGDGIVQLECLVDDGPFKRGLHFGYGHSEHHTVRVGQTVKAGEKLGLAGLANAWHVHFMVNAGGTTRGVGDRDPMPYVNYAKKKASGS